MSSSGGSLASAHLDGALTRRLSETPAYLEDLAQWAAYMVLRIDTSVRRGATGVEGEVNDVLVARGEAEAF
jgi:hypothetical protein